MNLFKKLVWRLNFYWVKFKFFLFTTNPKPGTNDYYIDKRLDKLKLKLGVHSIDEIFKYGIPSSDLHKFHSTPSKFNSPFIFEITDTEDDLIKKYGQPTSEEIDNNGELEFTHRIWKTELGEIHRFTVKEPEIPLEEKMKEAIENENYELAGELRDKINGK